MSLDRFPVLFQRAAGSIAALDVFGVPARNANPTKLPSIRTPQPDDAVVSLGDGVPLPPLLHSVASVGSIAVKDAAEQAGWALSVAAADVAASLDQLGDILILCHFTATSPA